MCPKITLKKNQTILLANSSLIERIQYHISHFHRITIAAIVLYCLFVIMFLIVNILMCIWNRKIQKKKTSIAKNKDIEHSPVPIEDEEESEISFDDERISFLEGLGVKIDNRLHRIFTSYVQIFLLLLRIKFFI